MSIEGGLRRVIVAAMIAGLLALPASPHARRPNGGAAPPQAAQEPDRFVEQQSAEDRSEAQEAREREQEKREREQEKKDQEQERLDEMQEMYDSGRDALEEKKFEDAAGTFGKLAQMNGSLADAALYWKAYAENQSGKRSTSLATIAGLKNRF